MGVVGVEALGDDAGNEGLAFLGKPVKKRAFLLNQSVDARRLVIQKPCKPPLGVEGRERTTGTAANSSWDTARDRTS